MERYERERIEDMERFERYQITGCSVSQAEVARWLTELAERPDSQCPK